MPNTDSRRDATIKSLDKAFEIVDTVRRLDGAGVTEVTDEVGYSKSTVHSHLATLEQLGFVVADGNEYDVGLRFLNLGGYALSKQRLYSLARAEIDSLAEETGHKATVMGEENGRGIYLYQIRGQDAVQTDSHIGTRVYLHRTALGKALLSELPRDTVDDIADRHGLPAQTDQTITDRETLHRECEAIRERGYAIDDEERITGIRCVAAPITTDDGDVLGALSVSGSTRHITAEDLRTDLAEQVRESARMIEINYMYSD
jgi:DNA-binding IclR family transcriptional regulator